MSGPVRTKSARIAVGVLLFLALGLAAILGSRPEVVRHRAAAAVALCASTHAAKLTTTSELRPIKTAKLQTRSADHVGTYACGAACPPAATWSVAPALFSRMLEDPPAPSILPRYFATRSHRSRAPPHAS